MADIFNFVMLVVAAVGAMVFGILAAYGMLRAGFGLMQQDRRRVAVKLRQQVARVL